VATGIFTFGPHEDSGCPRETPIRLEFDAGVKVLAGAFGRSLCATFFGLCDEVEVGLLSVSSRVSVLECAPAFAAICWWL